VGDCAIRAAGRVAALTLLKWHRLFLLLRTSTLAAQEKTRRGYPPGLRHNCKGYSFLPESRYIVKSFFVRGGIGQFECEKAFVIPKRLTDVSRMPTVAPSRVSQTSQLTKRQEPLKLGKRTDELWLCSTSSLQRLNVSATRSVNS